MRCEPGSQVGWRAHSTTAGSGQRAGNPRLLVRDLGRLPCTAECYESEDAQMVQKAGTRSGVIALSIFAIFCIAAVVSLLSLTPTDTAVVVSGGLAGAATSAVATLVRRGGMNTLERTVAANGSLSVLAPVIGGMAAGAFSIIVSHALLASSGGITMTGAAVHGGLYGLLLGGWINGILTPPDDDNATIASAALAEIGMLPVARRYNYAGIVSARVNRLSNVNLLFGTLTVEFAGEETIPPFADQGATRPLANQRRLTIDDGIDADEVPFELTVITPADLDAFPRTISVRIPRTGKSHPAEFTLAWSRRATEPDSLPTPTGSDAAAEGMFTSPSTEKGRSDTEAIILEVAQAGRSLHLLELSTINVDMP